MALSEAAKDSYAFEHRQASPATVEMIDKVMQHSSIKPQIKAAILLAWLAASRVGDVLQLKRSNVNLSGNDLNVTFCRGKTIRIREPYNVPTKVSPSHRHILEDLLANKRPSDFLFHADSIMDRRAMGTQVRESLKLVDPRLTQPSLRIGALQLMAVNGVNVDVMLNFSGHTTKQMLYRYIGWGKLCKVNRDAAAVGAALLAGFDQETQASSRTA
jgi:integrase